jgi:hypothetical protein
MARLSDGFSEAFGLELTSATSGDLEDWLRESISVGTA